MSPGELEAKILASRKYRHLCPETVARAVRFAAARATAPREIEARARKKLHQIFGAYLAGFDERKLAKVLEEATGGDSESVARKVLFAHASTRERVALVGGYFERIFAVTGAPAGILDLGAGLNPFSLPWMRLGSSTPYRGFEIDRRLVDLGNRFLSQLGRAPGLEHRDVLARPPDEAHDIVFLLKMLPCLEQQEEGASRRLLERLRARQVVVSFPTRTLGGRSKGFEGTYAARLEELLRALNRGHEKLEFPGELVYVVPGNQMT